jgi:hypothetical protein
MTRRSDRHSPPWHAALFAGVIVGNGLLAFGGLGVVVLAFALRAYGVASFAAVGVAAVVSAAIGIACPLLRQGSGLHAAVRVVSALTSAGVLVALGVVLAGGTVRGIAVLAAPLALGAPSALNIACSIVGLGRGRAPHLCRACGYDLRGTQGDRCPECGVSTGS